MVCLFGVGIGSQCGCTNYRDEDDSYDIEEKYGYSPDEMFNVTCKNKLTNIVILARRDSKCHKQHNNNTYDVLFCYFAYCFHILQVF